MSEAEDVSEVLRRHLTGLLKAERAAETEGILQFKDTRFFTF